MQPMNKANYAAQVIHGTYYPHIDGIRALAVLPVVFYHVLASLCPGGFAGVDVFFVISGYLITGSILRDLEKDRFTIGNFYYRRIRRILPAYFVLIAGVFVAGCAVYYSCPLLNLADASIMGSLFSANLYFWKLGGDYFAPDAHGNPLLHLWSLSVEEQFYLFIPLLCAMIWRFRRRWLAPTLATIAVLSFVGAVYAVGTGNQRDAFYLLHYRAWELLAGALLAMLPALSSVATERNVLRYRTLLAGAGLLLVLTPYVVLSSKTPFPGAAAFASVVGTALLIRYGENGWMNSLLAWRPFIFTGKISYSLYLWHWPVTVFWKYVVYDQLYVWDYIGMFLLSFLLAYLSWRFVEVPVRTSPAWTRRRSFGFAASGIVLLVSGGMACVFGRGWPSLLHREANELVASVLLNRPGFVESVIRKRDAFVRSVFGPESPPGEEKNIAFGEDGLYQLGAKSSPDTLVLGDSHAGVLKYGLNICFLEQKRGVCAISCSSTAMFNLSDPKCQDALAELERLPYVSKVFLVQAWSNYIDKMDSHAILDQLEEFAVRVRRMKKSLLIATDVPIFQHSPGDIAARMAIIAPREMESEWGGFQCATRYDQQQGEINRDLETLCRRTGATLVPMHLALKRDDQYIAFEKRDGNRISLYRDRDHVSPDGSLRAARFVMPYFLPQTSTAKKAPG